MIPNNSKLLVLDKDVDFKEQNKSQWISNSAFWLKGNMNHINDVTPTAIEIIKNIIEEDKLIKPVLFDIGCGEAWLLRKLIFNHIECRYYGTDFNELFINELNKEFKNNQDAEFILNDIELELPDKENSADIIVNAFNFFELPDINAAFKNTVQLLKKDGYLIIITIDPIMQLLAVSDTQEEFFDSLSHYSKYKTKVSYKKNIVIENQRTDRFYMGILYSAFDYIRIAKNNNLTLVEVKEVIQPKLPTPQIFQFLIFKK